MNKRRISMILMIAFVFCGSVWGSEDAHSGGEENNIFGGYPGEMIWTLVWFVTLLGALTLFAWKPLLAGLQSRQDHIEKQISEAENTRADASKVLEEYQSQLADAERQGQELMTRRLAEAEKQAKEVYQENQKDIEKMKVRMETEIEQERHRAEDDLWKQAGQIVQQLGQEVFGKTLDDQDNQKMIDEAIDRLKESERNSCET